VRHGARGAHALAGQGFEHLADFGLRHQRDVARDLARGERRLRHAPEEVDPGVAVGMPGARVGEAELHREAVAHGGSAVAARLEGADGAAELHREPDGLRLGDAVAIAGERLRPARDLEPRRDRHRGLHQRAAEHRRRAMLARARGERAHRGLQRTVRFLEGRA
jgi:hypothetical protein